MDSSQDDSSRIDSHIDRIALVVMRLSLAGWVGAALLFVATSVAEQVSPGFDAVTRDRLATIRFPWYYAAGTASGTLALASGVLCRRLSGRIRLALAATAAAGVVFALDYMWIYRPLQDLILPPGQPRSAEFTRLRAWSRNVNMVHLLLILFAAVQAAVPLPGTSSKRPA